MIYEPISWDESYISELKFIIYFYFDGVLVPSNLSILIFNGVNPHLNLLHIKILAPTPYMRSQYTSS
jgi:hypothetical protein